MRLIAIAGRRGRKSVARRERIDDPLEAVIRFKCVGVKALISRRWQGADRRIPMGTVICGLTVRDAPRRSHASDTLSAGLLTILRYRAIPHGITVFSTPSPVTPGFIGTLFPTERTPIFHKFRKRSRHRRNLVRCSNKRGKYVMYDCVSQPTQKDVGMNSYCEPEERLALSRYQLSSCVRENSGRCVCVRVCGIIQAEWAKTRSARREAEEREDRREEEGRGEGEGGRGKSARPQGREAITKLQKLTIKPDRHTGATIKLVPADRRIFLAFTTNHVATRRTSSGIRVSLPSREYGPRGWILPAERKLHGDFAPPFEMPL